MILGRMVITLVYDGYARSLEILAYNIFITNTIAGLIEFPANFMPLVMMDQLGRRWTLNISLVLTGLGGIIAGLLPTGIVQLN